MLKGDNSDQTHVERADIIDVNKDDGDHGQLASANTIREEIVSRFPQDHLVHCFGYGSGVFSQSLSNDTSSAGMLDLILVVDDTREFHKANLNRFPHHYAPWVRKGGPDLAAKIQREGIAWLRDAHVLFHVVDEDEENNLPKMKYGVIDKEDLQKDLVEWDSLYLAGRLHKPTLPIVANDDDLLGELTKNLEAATAAALLLLLSSSLSPTTNTTKIPWPLLYRQIAALSYTGDFRMRVGGEDPQKLDRLVQAPGQMQRFHHLYRPVLRSYESSGLLSMSSHPTSPDDISDGVEWNSNDTSAISHLKQHLPRSLQESVTSRSGLTLTDQNALAKSLAAIVAPAARNQSFKGIFTLGFRKSMQYASAKLSKGLLSRK
mmetsp:Transcript_26449/g.58247  ORF Transcript_26449/g.58247 Transcript_26449/m.58247 type:complete len:375 (+) Transcript_26449:285-1409(+)